MRKSRTINIIIATLVAAGGILGLASCSGGDEPNTSEGESSTLSEETTDPIFNQGGLNDQYPNGQYPSNQYPNNDQGNNNGGYIYNDPTYMNPGNQSTVTDAPITNDPTEDTSKGMTYVSNGNGTCTLTGIGSSTDACVVIPEKSPQGDIVTAISEKAFYGNTSINAIQIPSTVTSIGSCAFGGCTSLVYISVNQGNRSFKDEGGVLYSSDMSALVAYPASKGAATVNIPKTVTRIDDMAFYKCNSLRTVVFGGTQAEWASMNIGQMNYGLYTASVSCSDSGK